MSFYQVNNTNIIISGRIIKTGHVHDEEWLENGSLEDPEVLIKKIKTDKGPIDIFCFSQRLPETAPKYNYYMEWDNLAVVKITTFDEWWKGLPQATRKNVRRSVKRGVEVKQVDFNDEFVMGISNIYNETPIRQGRRFWHYGKDFDSVKKENLTYLGNCDFIGAYRNKELIGFVKLVYVGREARIMQIISMVRHQDARPTNALIAKAMEICEKKEMKYFIYGKFIYGKRADTPIIEFKNRNGFEMIEIPKYYVAISIKGKLALKIGLHHGIIGWIPVKLNEQLINLRTKWYERKTETGRQEEEKNSE
jgi:hypothetical protein